MTLNRRKEIEHRAVLAPWPDRGPIEYYEVNLTASSMREEAERFGNEVIDILWMKSVLMAMAKRLEGEQALFDGPYCETCGMITKHALRKCVEHSDA